MVFYIFILVALVLGLSRSYTIDPGKHIRAKIWNAITIIFLLLFHVDSIRYLIRIVVSPNEWLENIPEMGYLSGGLDVAYIIIFILLGIAIIWIANNLMKRQEIGRVYFLKILPYWAFLIGFSFYSGAKS